jgi:solute carrier family 25 citrate transporter 1
MSNKEQNKKKNPLLHLLAGGSAGLVESSVCHPLDTIKTRMQLRKNTIDTSKLKHSLVEPALRIKHSLQEPFLRPQPTLAGAGEAVLTKAHVHEPGFIGRGATDVAAGHAKVVVQPTSRGTVTASMGPIGTAKRIVQREGFFALYKGLSAVYTGIIPKMAIRFVSFEQYKELLAKHTSLGTSTSATFTAGLASGLTEAILVVTPAEVCKIRMQSQYHSMVDPAQMAHRKYRNVFQTAYTIVREEGFGALYKGVIPTMLRQGCNQAVNFTMYNLMKKEVMKRQETSELASWQSLMIGGLSGGMGPIANNPLDVVKTRLQKQVVHEGKTPKYTGLTQACVVVAKEEGFLALWKGITPRLLRIMPGQAITFMTYEFVSGKIYEWKLL